MTTSIPIPAISYRLAVIRLLFSVITMLSSNSAVSMSADNTLLSPPSNAMIAVTASIAPSTVMLPLQSSCARYIVPF